MPSIISFILFISIVISVYGFLNYYFLKKHNYILTSKTLPILLLRLIIFTIILTPIATIIFSQNDIPFMAAITGFTGYSWLAFLFLFLVIHGSADFIILLIEKITKKAPLHLARNLFIITTFISASIIAYGYFEASNIILEKITLESEKLPENRSKIKIIQISDVHFSPIISTEMAEKIYKITMAEKPDIIISTGDLLDRAIRNSTEVSNIMKKLNAPLGKYAITGNHEFIAGIDYSINFTKKCDFVLIRNDYIKISNILNLAGFDDSSAKRFGIINKANEKKILKQTDQKLYTIVLKHQPRIDKETLNYFDLQLSGHTHSGQIFPFTIFVKLFFPYIEGLYKLDKDTTLYVNRGTGTWGPPIRVLAPPEITLIEINKKK